MLQINRILFPTDYSACAEQAFSHAAFLAERYEAELHVLYVRSDYATHIGAVPLELASAGGLPTPDVAPTVPAGHDLQKHKNAGVAIIEVERQDDSAAEAVLSYAEEEDIDLIVMGTHGRRGLDRFLLGSVAEKVVRLAPCPVFTVRQQEGSMPRPSLKRILVPFDFSDHARQAVRYARELARTYGAHIDILHVVEQTMLPTVYGIEPMTHHYPEIMERSKNALRKWVEETAEEGVEMDVFVTVGYPAHDIVDFATTQEADLVVLATHGLTGIKRMLLGSVAEKVVQHAPCPVFTLKSFGKPLLTPRAKTGVESAP